MILGNVREVVRNNDNDTNVVESQFPFHHQPALATVVALPFVESQNCTSQTKRDNYELIK